MREGDWQVVSLLLPCTMNDLVMADEIFVDAGMKCSCSVFTLTEAHFTAPRYLEIAALVNKIPFVHIRKPNYLPVQILKCIFSSPGKRN